jgi:DNA repair exonuclease SbcCD ATPase subunit
MTGELAELRKKAKAAAEKSREDIERLKKEREEASGADKEKLEGKIAEAKAEFDEKKNELQAQEEALKQDLASARAEAEKQRLALEESQKETNEQRQFAEKAKSQQEAAEKVTKELEEKMKHQIDEQKEQLKKLETEALSKPSGANLEELQRQVSELQASEDQLNDIQTTQATIDKLVTTIRQKESLKKTVPDFSRNPFGTNKKNQQTIIQNVQTDNKNIDENILALKAKLSEHKKLIKTLQKMPNTATTLPQVNQITRASNVEQQPPSQEDLLFQTRSKLEQRAKRNSPANHFKAATGADPMTGESIPYRGLHNNNTPNRPGSAGSRPKTYSSLGGLDSKPNNPSGNSQQLKQDNSQVNRQSRRIH